jgi:DNA-binding transcriptional regulator GbsR (MarR family)
MNKVKLLSKQSKKIEREFVTFYKTVGKMVDLNPRMTEIFAYLKIYDALTQKQLKQLTGFSLGTISTTLQLFLQTDIIGREIIPKTHKNLYWIKPEKVNFVYTPSSRIIEDFERLDSYIVEKQAELEEIRQKYPIETQFLYLRLNGLRNYIEAQRRQINKNQKFTFFQESVSEVLPLDELVVYPFETREIEETIMDAFGFYRNDPIRNRILSVFYTHRSMTQQTLMKHTGFSRSTVSRFLGHPLNTEYIHALQRQHRNPVVYYLESISLSILERILNTDNYIYSSVPRFQETLSKLESKGQLERDREEVAFPMRKICEILEKIEGFKKRTKYLRRAYHDLSEFLEKDTH